MSGRGEIVPGAAAARGGSRRALRWLHLTVLALATHGSLYPWHLTWPADGMGLAWQRLLAPAPLWSGLGDVAGNIALFVPIGVLMLLDLEGLRLAAPARAAAMLALGTLFALLLQVAQMVVPERDPRLSDVVWNAAGLGIGALLLPVLRALRPAGTVAAARRVPLALVVLWLTIEWWPLLPTIDWQHVKDALKPLLLDPQWNPWSFTEAALGVLAVAHLLRGLRGAAVWLLLLVAAAAVGKLFVDGQALSLSRGAGFVAGLLMAAASWRLEAERATQVLVLAALAWLTADELRPFVPAEAPGAFHAFPFVALLVGSMSANTLALLAMGFWLGLVMWLARTLGARLGALAVGIALWIGLLELAQTWLPGRVADITPALLTFVWLLVLNALPDPPGRHREISRRSPPR